MLYNNTNAIKTRKIFSLWNFKICIIRAEIRSSWMSESEKESSCFLSVPLIRNCVCCCLCFASILLLRNIFAYLHILIIVGTFYCCSCALLCSRPVFVCLFASHWFSGLFWRACVAKVNYCMCAEWESPYSVELQENWMRSIDPSIDRSFEWTNGVLKGIGLFLFKWR